MPFAPELTAELAAAGPGQLQKHENFPSRFLRKKRDLIVYLPGIYQKRPELHFPVLYLEDGQNLFDPATSFIPGMYWRVGETADALIARGAIQPLIIVGIYNTGKQRINEYTPTRDRKLGVAPISADRSIDDDKDGSATGARRHAMHQKLFLHHRLPGGGGSTESASASNRPSPH